MGTILEKSTPKKSSHKSRSIKNASRYSHKSNLSAYSQHQSHSKAVLPPSRSNRDSSKYEHVPVLRKSELKSQSHYHTNSSHSQRAVSEERLKSAVAPSQSASSKPFDSKSKDVSSKTKSVKQEDEDEDEEEEYSENYTEEDNPPETSSAHKSKSQTEVNQS